MATSVKKESKLLAKHTLIYGLGNVFNRIVGFLMIPIYTRFLSPADYGILEIVTLTTQVIAIVAASGIKQAIGRFYFNYENDIDRNEVLSTSIIGFSFVSLFVLIPLIFFAPNIAQVLLTSSDQKTFFIIAISGIWFSSLAEIGFFYLRIKKQSVKFLIFSLTKLLIALSLNIYFIVVVQTGVIGVLYSDLITACIASICLTFPVFWKTGLNFSASKLKEMMRFGLPMIPSSIANMIVLSSDKFFLRFLVSLGDTGLYSLAARFAVIPGHFFVYPFMQIWSVRRFEIYKDPNSEEVMGRVFTYFCLLLFFLGLGICCLSREVIEIMADPKFWPAYKVIPILVLAQVILSFFQHFNLGILIAKKTHYFTYIDVSNGAVNLVLNYFFIKHYGMMGAAYATLISYTMRVVLVYIITLPLYRIYFEGLRIAKIFTSAAAVYILSLHIDLPNIYISIAANICVVMLYPVLLFLFRFFTPQELNWAKNFLIKHKSLVKSI